MKTHRAVDTATATSRSARVRRRCTCRGRGRSARSPRPRPTSSSAPSRCRSPRTRHQEAARDFLEYLYQPENIEAYNESQLGFAPTADAPAPDDPRIEGMIQYYEDGRVYQGPSVLVPRTMPIFNYAQAMVLGSEPSQVLRTMDADWARIAFRAPVVTSETKESAG
jgi:hypothetical protein